MKKRDFRPGWSCRCTLSTQCLHNAHSPHICCTFLTRLRPCRESYPLRFPKFQIVTAKYVGSKSEMIWNYPRRLLVGAMGSVVKLSELSEGKV